MKNNAEVKTGQEGGDPANMSRAGFWTWTMARLEEKPSGQPLNKLKPVAIDRLRPNE